VCASCRTNLDALVALPRRSEFEAGGIEAVEQHYAEQVSAYVGAPGPVVSRGAAMLIDNVLGFTFAVVAAVAVALAFDNDGSEAAGAALLLWFVLYPPFMLAFSNGQTLGKRAMGVRVENQTGEPIGFGRAFVRESLVKLVLWVIPLGLIVASRYTTGSSPHR
jgi:uncharacterized RDD family membrane protein YckC